MNHLLFLINNGNKNSIFTLAGYLEKNQIQRNYHVSYCHSWNELYQRINDKIPDKNLIIVAFSLSTPCFIKEKSNIEHIISQYNGQVVFIAGGPHATARPEDLHRIGIHYVFRGEAEESLLSFLNQEDRCINNLHLINGLSFDHNGVRFSNAISYHFDLNESYPVCDKCLKVGYLEIARGCPFSCHFCQTGKLFGTKSRYRSIENIAAFADFLKGHNYSDLRFLSSNATGYGSETGLKPNYDALEQMLSKVRQIMGKQGRIFFGSFPSEIRPEFADKKSMSILKQFVNNNNIIIGAQSGSDELLEKINRGHTIDDVFRAIEVSYQLQFIVNIDIIVGLPGETYQDQVDTLNFIEQTAQKFQGIKFHLHYFMPLPQTQFENENPGILSSKILNRLLLLTGQGLIYGPWKHHYMTALKITGKE